MSDRINDIRERCEAATPGPWTVENTKLSRAVIGGTVELLNWAGDKPFYSKDDFAFIAHAREDIPFLLAELDRLTEALRWIAVAERLPDDGEWVLALRFGRTHHLACYQHGHWMRRAGLVDKITHWMPLPEPPKEGAEHE